MPKKKSSPANIQTVADYGGLLNDVISLLETARRTSARAVNAIMTTTYWEIGRRIVEVEQQGGIRAGYGVELLKRLAADLSARFGRGFSRANLEYMRRFYLLWQIPQTLSGESQSRLDVSPIARNSQTLSGKTQTLSAISFPSSVELLQPVAVRFPLPWSHYVTLLGVEDGNARQFYEAEALRGGWSVRQLDRQINSQFYQRTLLSKNKAAMLTKGAFSQPSDVITSAEEIKDPLVLEFLDLKDEYSESDLEEALIYKLEDFLLELGSDFTFVGRQRRLRIGDDWYRIDLLFFHRRLRCLVVIALKIGKLTHADTGQMHLYLNYAKEHWTHPGENPPVGLILCARRNDAVAHYALEGLPNKVMAAEYKTTLPDEKLLAAEVEKTQRVLELRTTSGEGSSKKDTPNRAEKKRGKNGR